MGNLKRSDRDSNKLLCKICYLELLVSDTIPTYLAASKKQSSSNKPPKVPHVDVCHFLCPSTKTGFRGWGLEDNARDSTVKVCQHDWMHRIHVLDIHVHIYIYMYICNTTARQLETRHCKAGVPAQLNHSTAATEEARSTGATSHCGRNCVRPRNAAAQHSVAQVRCGCDEQTVNRGMLYTPTTQAGRSGKASAWVGG